MDEIIEHRRNECPRSGIEVNRNVFIFTMNKCYDLNIHLLKLVYVPFKVAEQLINPFGDDDEDFELNWLIDRHTKVSYLGVDTLMGKTPPLVKDKYFDDLNLVLPYTGAAVAYKKKTYRGSVHNMMLVLLTLNSILCLYEAIIRKK